MNLSETAFLLGASEPAADPPPIGLRWFTPTVEVDLCGHATLTRGGVIRMRVAGDRVHLGGHARTVVEGWLSV